MNIKDEILKYCSENKISQNEATGLTRKLDKITSEYQDLLRRKQEMIRDIKALITQPESTKRRDTILSHNAEIKALNKKIVKFEDKFALAVLNMKDEE